MGLMRMGVGEIFSRMGAIVHSSRGAKKIFAGGAKVLKLNLTNRN